MRKYIRVLIMSFGLWVPLSVSAHNESAWLQRIDTFEGLEEALEHFELRPDDLVIFDVDMVLTMPRDPLCHVHTIKRFEKEFRRFLKAIPKPYHDLALLYLLLQSPQQLTDERMPDLVAKVQKKSHQIYLTALLTGSFPQMHNAAEWRGFSLRSAKYDILGGEDEGVVYKNFPKHLGSYPKRSGNLLLMNGHHGGVTKGLMTIVYMREKALRPRRVIMIDDRVRDLESVHHELSASYPGIPFIGMHYVGAYQEPVVHEPYQKPSHKAFRKILKAVTTLTKHAMAVRNDPQYVP